jgi:hypothetical protein
MRHQPHSETQRSPSWGTETGTPLEPSHFNKRNKDRACVRERLSGEIHTRFIISSSIQHIPTNSRPDHTQHPGWRQFARLLASQSGRGTPWSRSCIWYWWWWLFWNKGTKKKHIHQHHGCVIQHGWEATVPHRNKEMPAGKLGGS